MAVPPPVDNCEWFYTGYVCNCTNISNAVPGFNTSCACRNGLVWVNFTCVADCSGSLAIGTSNPLVCDCVAGSSWNAEMGVCQRNCTDVVNSTGVPFEGNPSQCACFANYFWNESIAQCSDCSQISGTELYGSSNICRCNWYRVWLNGILGCTPVCSIILNSMVGHSNPSACLCMPFYDWNVEMSSCVLNCSKVPFTTAASSINETCKCKGSYYWVRNGCFPKANYVYSQVDQSWSINCSIYLLTNGFVSETECSCEYGWVWLDDNNGCVRDCSLDPYTTGLASNLTACICLATYYWDSSSSQCVINCLLYPRANGSVSGTNDCTCKAEWWWTNGTIGCSPTCASFNSTTGVAANLTACTCLANYYWSENLEDCYLNCSAYPHASATLSRTNCSCARGWAWLNETIGCIRDCKAVDRANGTSNFTACTCSYPYAWNTTNGGCFINCSLSKSQTCSNLLYFDQDMKPTTIAPSLIVDTQVPPTYLIASNPSGKALTFLDFVSRTVVLAYQ